MLIRLHRVRDAGGYAMAALLVALAIVGIVVSVAMPVWRTVVQREREEELIFRGEQYMRAVALFQRKYANAYPPSIDVLVDQRFLRRKYKDPMSDDGVFLPVYQGSIATSQPGTRTGAAGAITQTGQSAMPGTTPGPGTTTPGGSTFGRGAVGPQGGVMGVVSKSTGKSLRLYHGRSAYNEWQFVWMPGSRQPQGGPAGMPGQQGPGTGRGRGGQPFPGPGQVPGGRSTGAGRSGIPPR